MKNNDGLIEEMRKVFVPWDMFNLKMAPIERIVYGFAGLILTAFAVAIVALIIKGKP